MPQKPTSKSDPLSPTSALTDEATRLGLLIDAVTDYAIYILSPEGKVFSWNTGAERLKGYTAPEIIGQHFSTFFTKEDRQRGRPEEELEIAKSIGRYEGEGWRLRKDGTRFWASVVLTPIYTPGGHFEGFAKVTRDFTARRTLEEQLRQSEERFRLLVDVVKDYAIFMLNIDGTIASWNAGAQRAKGYTAQEAIGSHFSRFYTPEDRASGKPQELLSIAMAQGRVEDEGWRVRKDGSRFWADVVITAINDPNGRPIGFAKITRDMTAKRQAEETLRQHQRQINELQRMESIGRLVGGVAHDFNNMVMGILGCAEAAKAELDPKHPAQEEIDEIRKACERARNLTRQLMAYGRRQIATPRPVNLNDILQDLNAILRRATGSHVQMDVRLDPNLSEVNADISQLEQIIMNVVLNSRDAMPEGGHLLIRTANVFLNSSAMPHEIEFKTGKYAMLAVSDTGAGMTKEVLDRMFEPFFTTKEVGKGAGLGLSTVYGIVKQNGGSIRVESLPHFGTSFKVFLPVIEEPGTPDAAASEDETTGPAKSPSKTILVVEDEPLVLRNVVRGLQQRGYTVLSAANGQEALLVFEKTKGKIDLLISDIIMPGMNGKELAEKILERRPGLPVLLISGYPADVIAKHGLLREDIPFLEKPFVSSVIANKVSELLGPSESSH
jgi:PAS domain S-box-containing protein